MPYAFNENKTKFDIPTHGGEDWVDAIYPVGSVYMSVNQGPNIPSPADLFGGTWMRLPPNYYLMTAEANSASPYAPNARGGSKTINYTPGGTVAKHAITVAEMPRHRHKDRKYKWISFFSQRVSGDTLYAGEMESVSSGDYTDYDGGSQGHNHGFTGTATQFTIEPNYIAVNVWIRTA